MKGDALNEESNAFEKMMISCQSSIGKYVGQRTERGEECSM